MDTSFSAEELAFQHEVQEFFRNEYPQDVAAKLRRWERLGRDDYLAGQQAISERGWAGVNWPVEYGGTGWTPTQQHIFYTEAARAHAARMIPFGLTMVGPIIYTYGSEEQKARFLPDILANRVWWCQGYSEPGAGSDLASLKTRAVRDGDAYVVTGTKTWTTLAQYADWMFLLARTETDVARRQEGISFLVLELDTPGVSVKPIITLDGAHEVNEVHLEDVRVPLDNLIGEPGRGWTYGKVLLQHERTAIARVAESQVRLGELERMARKAAPGGVPLVEDPAFAHKLAAVEIELLALEYTDLRTLSKVVSGKAPGPESSILKIKGTELQQEIDTLYMEAAGYYALPFVPDQFKAGFEEEERVGGAMFADTALRYFNNRKATIYGGSNEIQRNIVAKRVLGV